MYHDFFYIFDECVNFGLWGIYYNYIVPRVVILVDINQ